MLRARADGAVLLAQRAYPRIAGDTVDGRNPAPVDRYPIIHRVSFMFGGAGFLKVEFMFGGAGFLKVEFMFGGAGFLKVEF